MGICFTTTIEQYGEQGEKTGWTFIVVPQDVALELKPNNKKSFRVQGYLDDFPIQQVAIMPMGDGSFMMAINAAMRKGIGKRKGGMLSVNLALDESVIPINADLLLCLSDDHEALQYFEKLPKSHQLYYSRWIDEAKTDATRAKRIAQAMLALSQSLSYSEMMRRIKAEKDLANI